MSRRTGSLVAAILVAAQLLVVAPPGRAAQVLEFTCQGIFPAWPVLNGTGSCDGTANTMGTGGSCAPACPFHGEFTRVTENCTPAGLAATGSYTMQAYVGPAYAGTYRMERTGSHVDYYVAGTPVPVGEGEMLFHPPIGTCSAPGPQAFTLTGRILTP